MPPCSDWITGDDVAECCSVETSSGVIFDMVAEQAQDLLFALSGGIYSGTCEKTVMACESDCECGGLQVLSRGHIIGPWDWGYWNWGYWNWSCGCPSRIKLSGFPVQTVDEVMINGLVLDPTDYRLDEQRFLVRLDGGRWPFCDVLCRQGTEEDNTITYTYGQAPPALGVAAAAQLACELYKECTTGTCALPTGTTRIVRQGITIERLAFTSWGYTPNTRARAGSSGWNTGLPLVDSFLNSVNRQGLLRRPTFWAPGKRYARPIV